MLWATYYGGNNFDEAAAVATDPDGNVFIAGSTGSTSGIATVGAWQTVPGSLNDAFLAKFDGSGAIKWATYFGGNNFDNVYGLATDASANVIIDGYTTSDTGIATAGAYQDTFGGYSDGYIAKFDSAGNLSWATYFGTSNNDETDGIYVSPAGIIYVSGSTGSTSGIATPGAWQTSSGGNFDAVLAKFDSSGALEWSTYYGSTDNDYNGTVSADASEHIYLTGHTESSSGMATAGAWQTALAGGTDAFLARFDSSGALLWSTYYGGPDDDEAYITTDPQGNSYLSGYTKSTSGIATTGAFQPVFGGGTEDMFLAQFDTSGILQWASYYGGSDDDASFFSPSADAFGNVYLNGETSSTSGIATAGAWQDTFAGDVDALLAKFSFCETPVAGPISGLDSVCIGDTITLPIPWQVVHGLRRQATLR